MNQTGFPARLILSVEAAAELEVPARDVAALAVWLNESPASLAYLGGALCLAGVAVSRARAWRVPRWSPAAQTDARETRAS